MTSQAPSPESVRVRLLTQRKPSLPSTRMSCPRSSTSWPTYAPSRRLATASVAGIRCMFALCEMTSSAGIGIEAAFQ